MRRSSDFRHAVRGGVRSGRATLVVHAAPRDDAGVQVGFVVAKAVGNAVTRNRVRRQLRHLARSHLAQTPAGTALVVRALPAAVGHEADLAADLAAAWARSLSRLDRRGLDQLSSAPS